MAENKIVIKLHPEQMAHLEAMLVRIGIVAERDEALERQTTTTGAGAVQYNCRCAPIPDKTTTQTEFTVLFSGQLNKGASAHFQAALPSLLNCYDPGWLLTCRDVKFDADGEEVCDDRP